jgi:hypothetical protein
MNYTYRFCVNGNEHIETDNTARVERHHIYMCNGFGNLTRVPCAETAKSVGRSYGRVIGSTSGSFILQTRI